MYTYNFINLLLILLIYLSNFSSLIDLVVTLPPTLINYWSSVRKQEGLEFTLNGLLLKIQYSLTLQPLVDGLVRRPRANWGMVACEGVATGLKGFTCIKRNEAVGVVWGVWSLI